ncbi:PAS domain S-box protein [Nocardioides sp. zg-ZUI104]|uniref:PAS domain S-box protein n=1 Tax=Nocardioides faecalis TaxID=2803858 RepID=UPI001BCAC98B|nr:PAS domain S-box protein [Nocardioides faecalis]MBS4753439.1 PAS domain S-box protein [Nocardioides faecalis]
MGAPVPRWVAAAPVLSGALVAAVGAALLAAFLLGDATRALRPDLALSLLGSGASLALHRRRPGLARRMALVPLAVGLLMALELTTGAGATLRALPLVADDVRPPHPTGVLAMITFALSRLLTGATRPRARILGAVAGAVFSAVVLAVQMGLLLGGEATGLVSADLASLPLLLVTLDVMLVGLLCCNAPMPPLNLLMDRGLAGTLVRRLLPAVVLGPALLAQVHDVTEHRGLLDPHLGLALFTAVMVVGLACVVTITGLTVQRTEQERLRLTQELEAIFASIPAMVTLADTDGTYVRSSPFADRLLLPEGGTLPGRNARDHYPANAREALAAQAQRTRDHGVTSTEELYVDMHGERRDWQLTRFPVTDGSGVVFGIGTIGLDITASKRTEREAAAASERVRSFLDAAPDATIIIDRSGTIRYANRRVNELLGYRPDELVGTEVECLVPEPTRSERSAKRAAYLRSPEHRAMGSGSELAALRKDGSRVAVEVSLGPVETKEGTWTAAALRDVTQRRAAELALRHAEQRARYLADHDPLTGTTNRRWFGTALERHLTERPAVGGLLIVDIDRFKEVNDSTGHGAGDTLLVEIVEAIGPCLPAGSALSRLGGDEFAVLLDAGGTAAVRSVAEGILEAVRRTGLRSGLPVAVTASIGAAPFELLDQPPTSNAAMVAADDALYAAKAQGRDTAVLWSPAVRRPRPALAGRRTVQRSPRH